MILELLTVILLKTDAIDEYNKFRNTQMIHRVMIYKDRSIARDTAEAAMWYKIDPYLLTALINSESGFNKKVKHKSKYVKGITAVNTKHWKVPLETHTQQIYAGAFILKHYLVKYDNDYLKALTAYKGISEKGRRQARLVLSEYERIKGK